MQDERVEMILKDVRGGFYWRVISRMYEFYVFKVRFFFQFRVGFLEKLNR